MSEYIGRKALVHHLENCIDEVNNTNGYTEDFKTCLRLVKNQPAADVEEVNHGKWEWFEEKHGTPIDGYDYDWGWHCSNCKAELSDDYDDPDTPPKMRYCPHCGAKMGAEG